MLLGLGLFLFGIGIAIYAFANSAGDPIGIILGSIFIATGALQIAVWFEVYVARPLRKIAGSESEQDSPSAESNTSSFQS